MKFPSIIGTSNNLINSLAGCDFVCQTIRNKIRTMQVNISIKIYLDHSIPIANYKKAVDVRYYSMMFGDSKLDIIENVEKLSTKPQPAIKG